MQVTDTHNVRIYNLSAGKSLPEWLSERKRRQLLKKNVDLRRRIELIQDFDMPGVSTCLRLSKDGQYIFACGIYKPRVKCFDVNNLSLKFERCFDSEVVTFEPLSDDYSKLVFLQCDRYIEFHSAQGRYHRLRIPRFGRDMKYHSPSCDLFVVGTTPEIYRFNLERGQFLAPFVGDASTINRCDINPVHYLLACGTAEGRVEAWDPRAKTKVATLDCGLNAICGNSKLTSLPSVTALKFNGALQMAVGTSTGQVLMYDIRSTKPFYVKDHMYGFPIKDVEYHFQNELIYSMDQSVLKIWNKNDGKVFTSIESNSALNNLCVVPNTGMLFMANENQKILSYYIPSLGPAPKWAAFLDSITEELHETTQNVYDDYKFVTHKELLNLGLDHLIGTNLLKAFMHGYFVDARLYKKVKQTVEPFELDEYRKKKIREKLNEDRISRVQIDKLPKVNQELAMKLMATTEQKKRKAARANTLLQDNRFKAMFENPDFQVDKNADEYRLLNPVLSRLDKNKEKQLKRQLKQKEMEQKEDEVEGRASSDEDDDNLFGGDDSSDDDHTWTKDVKKQYRQIEREKWEKDRSEAIAASEPRLIEINSQEDGEFAGGVKALHKRVNKSSLGDRLHAEGVNARSTSGGSGNRTMTFSMDRNRKQKLQQELNRKHQEERRKLVRNTRSIKLKKPRFQ